MQEFSFYFRIITNKFTFFHRLLTSNRSVTIIKLPNGYFIEGDNYGRGYKGTDFENSTGTVCSERLPGDVYE